MFDPSSHVAGLASNTLARHAFWIVVRREGSAIGSCRAPLAMFACPSPADVIFTFRFAPLSLLPRPPAVAVSFGLNGRLQELTTWNGVDTAAAPPWAPKIVAEMAIALQLVGLNWKFGRSTVAVISLICDGMPLMNCGNGSLVIVTAAVVGSTLIVWRTVTSPR